MIHGHWLESLGIEGEYDKQDVPPDRFGDFLLQLRERGYVGANVTVPHKEAAYQLVERRDPAAEVIGAVNTIWFEGETLCGGNSDAHGFIASLDEYAPGWDVASARAVVLGAGGAAHAAAFALHARGVAVAVVNRTMDRARQLAARFGDGVSAYPSRELSALLAGADLLANCTSLGMVGQPPLASRPGRPSSAPRWFATRSTSRSRRGCCRKPQRGATGSSTGSECSSTRPATGSTNGSARCPT